MKGKNKPGREKGICLKRKRERRRAEEDARKEAHMLLSASRREDLLLSAEIAADRQRRNTRLKLSSLIRAGGVDESHYPAFA